MKQQLYSGVSAFGLLMMPAFALAQETAETLVFELDEIVIFSSKKEETFLRFPGTVAEQSGDALKKQKVRTLLDLEKALPELPSISAPRAHTQIFQSEARRRWISIPRRAKSISMAFPRTRACWGSVCPAVLKVWKYFMAHRARFMAVGPWAAS